MMVNFIAEKEFGYLRKDFIIRSVECLEYFGQRDGKNKLWKKIQRKP